MSTFETVLNVSGGPLCGGGPRRLPHWPNSKSAYVYLFLSTHTKQIKLYCSSKEF